jgi:hypothetical protein
MTTRRKCRQTLRNLVGARLDPGRKEETMEHLEQCPECREEEARLRKLLDAAEARRDESERVMATIDWEALAGRIADEAERRGRAAAARPERRTGFLGLIFRPALAYLLVGLVVGGLGTFGAFKAGLFSPRGAKYFASPEFLDQAQAELARRETISYLERGQYLLLDVAQTSPGQAGKAWSQDVTSGATADLLSRKKFIDPQLSKIPMAKAREICDQIEALCLELTQLGTDLDEAQWKEIQDRVRQSHLLLKIDLVKKELERHEI